MPKTRSSNALLTTLLDLIGSLLIILAVALAVAMVSLPLALGAAGVLLMLLSWLVDRRSRP
ncbi:hypothetical protein [Glutamicibacter sp. X7]